MRSKEILCDSGSFISLTGTCLDSVLRFLSERFSTHFIIPPWVEYEMVEKPLEKGMRQYSFSAIKIKELIKDGVILKVNADVASDAERILSSANHMLFAKGKPITLIQSGEAQMLALARRLDVSTILIDERTTRMLIEAPYRMKDHVAEELGVNVMVDKRSLGDFSSFTKGMSAIRSCELVMVAYENGFFDHFGALKIEALEAALYKLRFSGCSIRFDEIEEYMRMVK